MKFESVDECAQALYGVLSFLKNNIGFDAESNLVEQALHMLNAREDAKEWEAERQMDMSREAEIEADSREPDEPCEPYPPSDQPDEPCASCNGQCDNGFPCHQYDGCEA